MSSSLPWKVDSGGSFRKVSEDGKRIHGIVRQRYSNETTYTTDLALHIIIPETYM